MRALITLPILMARKAPLSRLLKSRKNLASEVHPYTAKVTLTGCL